MTSERLQHYRNAIKQIDEFKEIKLFKAEYELLADSVEGCLLTNDDLEAEEYLFAAASTLNELVATDRWLQDTADKLFSEIKLASIVNNA